MVQKVWKPHKSPWAADVGFLCQPSMEGIAFPWPWQRRRVVAPTEPSRLRIHGGSWASRDCQHWPARCGCSLSGSRSPAQRQQCHASPPSAPVSAGTCCPMAIDGCPWGRGTDWGRFAPGPAGWLVGFGVFLVFLHPCCCHVSRFSCGYSLQECSICALQIYIHKYMRIYLYVYLYTRIHTLY